MARGEIIVSKEGFNVEGGDLEVMLENKNANASLNDIGTVLGQTDLLSALGNITAKRKNFDGTFTNNIQSPTLPNSLDVLGMRVVESGGFIYDAPTILSSDWDTEERPKMIDRVFGTDPATLKVDNNETKETVFNFGNIATRDLIAKISADINSGTPNLTFDIQISDDNAVYVSVDSGILVDGVFNLTQTNQSFQFVKVIIIAEDENPFDINMNIFEVFDRISSPVSFPFSDFTPTTNINDGNLDTFVTLNSSNPLPVETIVVGDFGSIANRKLGARIESVLTSGSAITTFDLEISNDNAVYVSVDSGILVDGQTKVITTGDQLFQFARITLSSTDALKFIVDHRIYQLFEFHSATINSDGGLSSSTNMIDGDISTFATINGRPLSGNIDIDFEDISSKSVGFTLKANVIGGETLTDYDLNLLSSNDDVSYTNQFSVSLGASEENVTLDFAIPPVSLQFARLNFSINSTANFIDFDVFEIYTTGIIPTIISYTGSDSTNMVDGDLTTFASEIVSSLINETVADFGTPAIRDIQIKIKSTLVSGTATSSYEILISDDNISFVSIDSNTLVDNTITNVVNKNQSFRYVKLVMSVISENPFNIDQNIYEIYGSSPSSVLTSDWPSTTNMDDSDLDTFETLNVTNTDTIKETVFDFITTISRDIHALIRPNTINGTPIYSYILSGSLDNISFFTIDSGTLTDGIITDASGTPVVLRYVKIEITGTETGTFEADFDIFEIYDANVINALDFSTVLVGGSTSINGAINQTDPLTFQIADNSSKLQPNQPFTLEAAKFLTMNVTALRTGQAIQLDRVTTATIQRG